MFDYSGYAGIETCIAYPARNEYILTKEKKVIEFVYGSESKTISTNTYSAAGTLEKKNEKTFEPVEGSLDSNEDLTAEINSGTRLGLYEDVQAFIEDNKVFLEKDEKTVADWVEGKVDIDPDDGKVITVFLTPEIDIDEDVGLPFGDGDALDDVMAEAEEKSSSQEIGEDEPSKDEPEL